MKTNYALAQLAQSMNQTIGGDVRHYRANGETRDYTTYKFGFDFTLSVTTMLAAIADTTNTDHYAITADAITIFTHPHHEEDNNGK